jgi:hypothetical protein
MSMNINSHKIGETEIPSSRTPQFAVGGSGKKKDSKRSIFSTRKTPNLKSVKKEGYNRNRPPLYERDIPDNSSSLPVIVNSLNASNKNPSDTSSPDIIKRYELKGKILKPSQRLSHLRYKSKVSY